MSDYDNRQYRLMVERIDQFEKKSIGLRHLITDLEALLCVLQEADQNWKSAFHKQWAVIEEVYAVVLDRKLKEVPQEYWKLIDDAVSTMKQLLTEVVVPESEP